MEKALRMALENDDIDIIARHINDRPELRQWLSTPDCVMPLLGAIRSTNMVNLLLENGLGVRQISEAWAPGFGTGKINPDIGKHLIEQGADASIHALAGMGLVDRLERAIMNNAEIVHAKGGDGCHPLHFARTLEVAQLLVHHGVDIDAKDEDHDSTPAQWHIDQRPEITRYLIEQGSSVDIFMAAGLGDLDLAQRIVKSHPHSTTDRIGNNDGPFPGIGFQDRGGTIYQWTLGFNLSPHEVAFKRGHVDVYDFLMDRTDAKHRLLVACMLADSALAKAIIAEQPEVMSGLTEQDHMLLAKSCWETNLNIEAVRLMLDIGFPVDLPEPNHGFQALHNAAWCGHRPLVELLLAHHHPVEIPDPRFQSTPIGWAIHSCIEGKRHPNGDFAGVIKALLGASAKFDAERYPTRDAKIDAVLKKHLEG